MSPRPVGAAASRGADRPHPYLSTTTMRRATDGAPSAPPTLRGMVHDGGAADVRILLVDRAGAGRSALAGLLGSLPGVTLVGVAGESDDLEAAMLTTHPAVVVLDDRIGDKARAAFEACDVNVIAVGLDDHPGFAARARARGALAWVPKEQADSLLPGLLLRP